jgi:hypothetical protein
MSLANAASVFNKSGAGVGRAHAARPQPAAAEAVAADPLGRVDDRRAQPAVGGAALQEGDVGGQAGQADQVHRDALQLERDAAHALGLGEIAAPASASTAAWPQA